MKRKSRHHSLNLELQLRMQRLERKIALMQVELDFKDQLKNEAMQQYVNDSISTWNSAVRATSGPRPKETPAQYNARLVAANKKEN